MEITISEKQFSKTAKYEFLDSEREERKREKERHTQRGRERDKKKEKVSTHQEVGKVFH